MPDRYDDAAARRLPCSAVTPEACRQLARRGNPPHHPNCPARYVSAVAADLRAEGERAEAAEGELAAVTMALAGDPHGVRHDESGGALTASERARDIVQALNARVVMLRASKQRAEAAEALANAEAKRASQLYGELAAVLAAVRDCGDADEDDGCGGCLSCALGALDTATGDAEMARGEQARAEADLADAADRMKADREAMAAAVEALTRAGFNAIANADSTGLRYACAQLTARLEGRADG